MLKQTYRALRRRWAHDRPTLLTYNADLRCSQCGWLGLAVGEFHAARNEWEHEQGCTGSVEWRKFR